MSDKVKNNYEETIKTIEKNIKKFDKTLETKSENTEDFIRIEEIETHLEELNSMNKSATLDHVGKLITNINEKKLMDAKKKNLVKKI